MANPFTAKQSAPTQFPVMQDDSIELARQQRMAEMLRQQAEQPMANGGMVGGVYVPQHWTQGLAHVANQFAANNAEKRYDDMARSAAQKSQSQLADVLQRGQQAATGTPEKTYSLPDDQLGPQGTDPAKPGNQLLAAQIYMMHPSTMAMGQEIMKKLTTPGKFGTTPHFDQQGRAYVTDDNGNVKYLTGDIKQRDKIVADDVGGQKVFRSEYGVTPVSTVQKTYTPDALLTDARTKSEGAANRSVTVRGQNLGDMHFQQNFNAPTYHDGAWVGKPNAQNPAGSIVATPNYVPPKGSNAAQVASSTKLIPLLDEANKLLDTATGSSVGAARDAAYAAVGQSTKGAQSAAQLKSMEGQIMMAQPRMEGPQSDKDVALYRQMAAQIGDSTVPNETRRAALKGLRDLHIKYAGQQLQQPGQPAIIPAPQAPSSPAGWSIQEVK